MARKKDMGKGKKEATGTHLEQNGAVKNPDAFSRESFKWRPGEMNTSGTGLFATGGKMIGPLVKDSFPGRRFSQRQQDPWNRYAGNSAQHFPSDGQGMRNEWNEKTTPSILCFQEFPIGSCPNRVTASCGPELSFCN